MDMDLFMYVALAIIAIFIVKTVLKIAFRLAFIAVLAVLAFLYFSGNLPFPL